MEDNTRPCQPWRQKIKFSWEDGVGAQTEKGAYSLAGFLANQKSNLIFNVASILWGGGHPSHLCVCVHVFLGGGRDCPQPLCARPMEDHPRT